MYQAIREAKGRDQALKRKYILNRLERIIGFKEVKYYKSLG